MMGASSLLLENDLLTLLVVGCGGGGSGGGTVEGPTQLAIEHPTKFGHPILLLVMLVPLLMSL